MTPRKGLESCIFNDYLWWCWGSWSITLWETLAQTLGQVRLVQHTAPSMVCPWPPVFSAVALTRSGGDALSLSVTHISTPFPPSLDLHTVPSAWNLALFYYLSHNLYCSMTQTHGHIPLSKVLKLAGFVSLNLGHRSLLDGWLMKTCNAHMIVVKCIRKPIMEDTVN